MLEIFKQFKMKLNPLKCAFGVSSGQFLGYFMSRRGIEPILTQINTLSQIEELKTVKDVQILVGKVAALSHFISKMFDRCEPFFRNIKQCLALEWGRSKAKHSKS